MKFLTLTLTRKKKKKERERERSKNNPTSKKSVLKLLKIVTIVTDYHKLSLLPLVIRPSHKFEKQKMALNFESCYYFR